MNKKNIVSGVVVVVVAIVAFYTGTVYGKSGIPARDAREMQTFGQNFNGNGAGLRNMGGMGGFTAGQIIAKDDKSITVSLMNGGSKIIFLDTSTKVSKQAEGTVADLKVGTQVSVTGTPNSDGSINATTVQIRPNTSPVLK